MKEHILVLATRNRDKIREIRDILQDSPWTFRNLDDFPGAEEVIEDGQTFEENALKKARACCRHTGMPSLADDSGLEVAFLKGRPGVQSNRFAGAKATYRQNNDMLVRLMGEVSRENRKAKFRCIVAFVHGEYEKIIEGICEGYILSSPRGDQGFGYDPLFFKPEKGKTFAEMSGEEKNRISHRGNAFRNMDRFLREYYGTG